MIRLFSARRLGLLFCLWLIACASLAAAQQPLSRGEYAAILGDCIACHTLPGGEPFAGGVKLPTPVGDIIATNITPLRRGYRRLQSGAVRCCGTPGYPR